METKGYVNYVGAKKFGNKDLWSFSLKGQNGFFRTGSTDPRISKNDLISFQYSEGRNGSFDVDVASIRKVDLSRADVPSDSPPSSRSTGDHMSKDDYWRNKELRDLANEGHRKSNELRIQWQSARNAAIAVVDILTREKALVIPEKKGAGSEVILGKIADLTNEFYQESSSVGESAPSESSLDDAEIPFDAAKEAF